VTTSFISFLSRSIPWLLAAAATLAAAPVRARDAVPEDDLASVLATPVYGSSRLAGASKYEQDLAEAPTLVYVRTAGEIRAQGYRTLADVLESMPGVHLRYDRVYTHVGVRGINPPGDYSARLLVLIDGVRVNEAIYDSATLGREFPLDIALIERVEFIPGPGSSLYGSNAVLGVVNVITRNPSQLPGLNAAVEAASAARRKLALSWGGDAGPVRLLLGATHERSRGRDLYFPTFDAPATNNGWAIGQDGELADTAFLKGRWADLTLTLTWSDRTKHDPTAAYGSVFDTPSWSTDRYALADLSYSRAFGVDHEVFARLGAARYRYRGLGLYDKGDPSGALVPSQSPSEADWSDGELRYVWSGWQSHRVLVGLEFQHNRRQEMRSEDLAPAPHVYADLALHSERFSLFANDEWQLTPTVRLNLGARADRRLDGRRSLTPRVAALWAPSPQWTFKLQRGSAFREPNISETHYSDGSQQPNPALRAESLDSTELSALWRPQRGVEASLSLYDLRIEDLITLIPLPDGSSQYWNQGRVRSQGIQLEGTWEAGAGVQWRASWSVQNARDDETGIALGDAPRTLGKLSVTAPLPVPGARLGTNLQWVGARHTLAGATVAGYTRINLQFNLAPPGQPWNLGVGLVNLSGRRHADPAGPEHQPDALEQDGREFVVRFGWAF
jgi:iron complex outermembrane receptor protein